VASVAAHRPVALFDARNPPRTSDAERLHSR
jgi:hypothetical protein